MKPELFLTTHRVFTSAELQAALAGRARATVDSCLSRWRQQGRITRVKRGVFVRQDGQGAENDSLPDFVPLASRMAPDAAVAYHTALEIHGCAQSLFEHFTFVTWTGTKPTTYLGRRFGPVRPRARLRAAGGGERWTERAERAGTELHVTSLERTVADVLDRPALEVRGFADPTLLGEEGYQKLLADIEAEKSGEPASRTGVQPAEPAGRPVRLKGHLLYCA